MTSDNPEQPDNPEQTPKVRLARGQEVSLGCGTMIVIALIVMIFSNSSRVERADLDPVLRKLEGIEQRLDRLEKLLEEPKAQPKDK